MCETLDWLTLSTQDPSPLRPPPRVPGCPLVRSHGSSRICQITKVSPGQPPSTLPQQPWGQSSAKLWGQWEKTPLPILLFSVPQEADPGASPRSLTASGHGAEKRNTPLSQGSSSWGSQHPMSQARSYETAHPFIRLAQAWANSTVDA